MQRGNGHFQDLPHKVPIVVPCRGDSRNEPGPAVIFHSANVDGQWGFVLASRADRSERDALILHRDTDAKFLRKHVQNAVDGGFPSDCSGESRECYVHYRFRRPDLGCKLQCDAGRIVVGYQKGNPEPLRQSDDSAREGAVGDDNRARSTFPCMTQGRRHEPPTGTHLL